MTFKQLEAVYWIAQLGGFAAAARKLSTTQSAISKRVQELETEFDTPLFDRSQRQARLTDKGEQMFALAKSLLEHRNAAIEQFSRPEIISRRVRIGVTELTAMTWLPRLVRLVQQHYPRVTIEPDVDLSVNLRDRLLGDEIDLAIVPQNMADPRFTMLPVGNVENAWMCKPGLLPVSRTVRLDELARHTLLTQGNKSGTGLIYGQWFQSEGISPENMITTDSLVALIGMTVSGLGVSYLPRAFLGQLVEQGALAVVKSRPAPPVVLYVALWRTDSRSTLVSSIASLAQKCCDFSRMFQTVQSE
jgi:DNA-binding transcriptional LysR family regulator